MINDMNYVGTKFSNYFWMVWTFAASILLIATGFTGYWAGWPTGVIMLVMSRQFMITAQSFDEVDKDVDHILITIAYRYWIEVLWLLFIGFAFLGDLTTAAAWGWYIFWTVLLAAQLWDVFGTSLRVRFARACGISMLQIKFGKSTEDDSE